ncbi:type VI secretion system membrane subunit TssM [Limoniibacter endophyticus]|uniref:Type VI secretion protein IcmF n=1 Tax=Limoniibacter endophyticus TaxID=1565040 RepID=A0A8J3DI98_9HYPH|nr:type VI secretion system membrane subunit TssM [Limoniibacter endophyticus]GHC69548.1 type VI secretion protein IcmF [Limoniibacter endophyticus]
MNPLSSFYVIRSHVESYASLIGYRFLSLFWIVALGIVIWFYGSMLALGDWRPLTAVFNRIVAIGILILGWVLWTIISLVRARRRDDALVEGIEQNAAAEAAAGHNAEVEEIHGRLKEAMSLLKRIAKKRFGYVYELPWYVVFGAPGSGKTTALTNSGLKFPLGDALGQASVEGMGGTRNCNWWFAEEAILIDTAGRYTTQDDLNGTSRAGWEGFLSLLKKYRKSQPINGVIVTLSIGDLMKRDEQVQLEEVRAVRQRLSELDDYLGARVPVYLMLTKADLMTGFVEFFDGLSKSDRDQVWGMTFGLEESYGAKFLPERFMEEFTLLQERIGAMLLERMQQEPDAAKRGRIFRLPAELASLKERLHEVMGELCASSRLVEAPLLRGVYFASGTQSDVATIETSGSLSRLRRSYFIERLFKGVIFEEASLITRDKRLSRRQRMLRRGAYALAGFAFAFILAGWFTAYFQNSRALAQAQDRIAAYDQQIQGIAVRDVSDADFLRVLPALDSLRNVTAGFQNDGDWMPRFGLDQGEKIAGRQREAYQRALNALLLPRVLVQLQGDIEHERDAETPDVARTFNTLKLYGMLGGLGPVDRDFVAVQAQDMFERLFPGEGRRAARNALVAHVEALARGAMVPITLDTTLIAEARAIIADQSLGNRAFDILVNLRDSRALGPWNAADASGPLGEQVFARKSGATLRESIPGIYTGTGYRAVVLPRVSDAARQALAEEWVRGWQANPAGSSVETITQAALQLYFDQFAQRWNALLADIVTRPSQTLGDATETLRVLSSDPGPVETIAKAIAAATDLGAQSGMRLASTGDNADAIASASSSALVTAANAPDPYGPLREALEVAQNAQGPDSEQPRSRIGSLRPILQKLYGQLSRASTSSGDVAQMFDVDSQLTNANQDLIQEARTLPAPVDQWMASVSADIGGLAVKTARGRIGNIWAASGANLCGNIVSGRYPFDRESSRDVAMADFVRLFGPSGLFQSFFKDRLEPFVDKSESPWGWRGTFGGESIPSPALAQFENADRIHRAFFPAGSEQPAVSINVRTVSLARTNAAMLSIQDESIVQFADRPVSKSFRWPAQGRKNQSYIAFQPSGIAGATTTSGDWSPFRLFDRANIQMQGDDVFLASFDKGAQRATFEVQFGSVLNPFRLPALTEFRCPTQF